MSRFLVYDGGLSVEHAARIARGGHSVRYFTSWNTNFPSFVDYSPGLGVKGLEKTLHFLDSADWADCICFFDTGAGDMATYLRKNGHSVFGAGLKGEKLENHRYWARWVQQDLGLPVQETARIQGVTNLREYLKTHKNVVIKHDIFRGDLETVRAPDLESVDQLISDVGQAVGPFKEEIFFTVEESLDGIEPGFDLFFNGKDFVRPYVWGYESHSGYIGTVTNTLPDPLALLADKLTPYLRSIDYRGAISTEAIIGKDGKPYVIDYTARMPYPLSLAYAELIDNFPEVVKGVADAESVEIEPAGKYIACLPLTCPYASERWLKVNVEPSARKWVKINMLSEVGGSLYTIKSPKNPVNIVRVADSVEECIDGVKDTLEKVSAHELDGKESIGTLENVKAIIEEGKSKYGLEF